MMSWLLVGVLVLIVLWVSRKWARVEFPDPPSVAEFRGWSPELQRRWMAHPAHKRRCACRRFGLPWTEMAAIGDEPDPVLHDTEVCVPLRETLFTPPPRDGEGQ